MSSISRPTRPSASISRRFGMPWRSRDDPRPTESARPAMTESAELQSSPQAGGVPEHAKRRGVLYIQILLLVALIAIWQGVADRFDTEFWTSSPLSILAALFEWYESGLLVTDLRLTLFEAGIGFVLGSIGGGVVGFVLGWVRKLGDIFEPFVLSIYTLPKICLLYTS